MLSFVNRSLPVARTQRPARALPIVHRLAVLYLAAPLALWLLGWFKWWVGAPLTAALVLALGSLLAGPWRGRRFRLIDGSLWLLALAWIMVSAPGGLFDGQDPDWHKHRTLLLDLGRYPWPTFLPDALAAHVAAGVESEPLLRYHLGWYLAPGLAARLFGPGALHWAVPLWSWIGAGLILSLFSRAARRQGPARWLAAVLFLFFSSLNIPQMLWSEWERFNPVGHDLASWLSRIALDVTERHWAYADQRMAHFLYAMPPMVAFSTIPQHFIPAALYSLLLRQLRHHPRWPAASGVALAAAPFWSAFVAVGLLPFIIVWIWRKGARAFLSWPNLCLAGPLAGVSALYLMTDSEVLARGWIWEQPAWGRELLIFYVTGFGALAAWLWIAQPRVRREPFFGAGLLALSLLSLYLYGGNNDFMLRAALPSLVLLGYLCAEILLGRRGPPRPFGARARCGRTGLLLILGAGALDAVAALAVFLAHAAPFRYAQAPHTALVELQASPLSLYVAFELGPALPTLLQEPASPHVRPGPQLVRGAWDIYLTADALAYVKEPCRRDDMASELYFAIRPVSPDRLSSARADNEPLLHMRGDRPLRLRRVGPACGALERLPSPPARIQTGQQRRGNSVWFANLAWPAAGAPVRVQYGDGRAVQAAYTAAAAEVPTLRAGFDVYVAPDAVTFAKAPCRQEDMQPRFRLHVTPLEMRHLPPHQRRFGFDNLDFSFGDPGARFAHQCLARVPLPAYGIARLVVGQNADAAQSAWLWRAAIPFADLYPRALDDLRAAYAAVAAAEPTVRSVFNVYAMPDAVIFAKAPCLPEHTDAKFILHVVPAQSRDLARSRRRLGFDNLDFPLAGYGAHFDGKCLARRDLPPYGIARLRVGQYDARAQRALWQEEILEPDANAA